MLEEGEVDSVRLPGRSLGLEGSGTDLTPRSLPAQVQTHRDPSVCNGMCSPDGRPLMWVTPSFLHTTA